MEPIRRIGFDPGTRDSETPDSIRSQFSPKDKARQYPEYVHDAEVFKDNNIQLAIINPCVGCEVKPAPIARRVKYPNQQDSSAGRFEFAGIVCDAHKHGAKREPGPKGAEDVTGAPSNIAIRAVGVTNRLSIQADSSSSRVESLVAVSRANLNGVKEGSFTVQEYRGGLNRIRRKTESCSKVIPTAGRNDAQDNFRILRCGIDDYVKRAVTSEDKDARATRLRCGTSFCGEILRTFGNAENGIPSATFGKLP